MDAGTFTRPKNYWKNTSHNGILLTFVKRTDFDVAEKFETLLNGGSIVQAISDELTYDTLHSTEDNLWSVPLMTGYITKADLDKDCDKAIKQIIDEKYAEGIDGYEQILCYGFAFEGKLPEENAYSPAAFCIQNT